MKTLTSYTDYRIYLKDWIAQRRLDKLPASNRWFAQRIGINSSSWLTSVLQGKKGLSDQTAAMLSQVLKHNQFETLYFKTLVQFNQAKTRKRRNECYEQLVNLQNRKEARVLTGEYYKYYDRWYHSAIRALIGCVEFKGNYDVLAAMVSPPITPSQARKSVELLESLELIKHRDDGVYELTDKGITTGDYIRSLAIENYQQATMLLAQEAIDRYRREIRDISTLTIGISREKIGLIKDILKETRRKIADIADTERSADSVFQLNIQLFPLSKVPASSKESQQ